jgi:leucine dehydrogenase
MQEILEWTGEQLVCCRDRETGLRAAIAIDDTTRGPALGGVRYRPYADLAAAAREAQRLAVAMTYKNAAAELPYGGAKAVIVDDGAVIDRPRLMRTFGAFVARLGGAYIPGVDMGTTVEDLAEIATVAPDVACHDEDPSPWTAMGVWAGIRAAVNGAPEGRLHGIKVVVQGAGHVGAQLATELHASGAELVIADVVTARARDLAARLGATVVAPGDALEEPCDVFAPCATAKVLDSAVVGRLRCRWVAGAANDTLAERGVADRLAERGITYVPDFILNAGGVIQIHAFRERWTDERLAVEVLRVGDRVADILAEADAAGRTPLDVAETRAVAALSRPTGVRW